MEEIKKPKVVDKHPGKEADENHCPWDIPEKRLRFVDFRRIEDNRNDSELGNYELEVKEKIACVPSPYDYMERIEKEDELELKERRRNAKLGHLASQAQLSPQQRKCYELLYVEKLAEAKIRRRLGIKQARLCQLKQEIQEALIHAHKKGNRGALPRKRRGKRDLTQRQKQVLSMRHRDGLSFEKIAQQLGISTHRAYEIFQEVQKKVL